MPLGGGVKAKFTALYDGIRVDSEDGVTLKGGVTVPLSPKELSMLCLLMSEAGRAVEKVRILDEVWGSSQVGDGSLMRCASSLRKKLNQYAPTLASAIKTQFGRGYRFVGDLSASQTVVIDEAFYALIDASPDFIALKDGEGRWQAVNAAGLAMYKLYDLDWIGKSDLELGEMVPEFRENLTLCHRSDEEAWRHGRTLESIEYVKTPEIELVFQVFKSPIFHPDVSRKTLVVHGRNVTDLLRVAKEL